MAKKRKKDTGDQVEVSNRSAPSKWEASFAWHWRLRGGPELATQSQMGRRGVALSELERDIIRKMVGAGSSYGEVAREIGRPTCTVREAAIRMGVRSTVKNGSTPQQKAWNKIQRERR